MGPNLYWVCRLITIAILLLSSGVAVGQAAGTESIRIDADYRLSGPYVCRNLDVFFIHGKTGVKGNHFISLAGETGKNYSFETKDGADQTIHLNIIAK
jgi:hypothetical protein